MVLLPQCPANRATDILTQSPLQSACSGAPQQQRKDSGGETKGGRREERESEGREIDEDVM
eukprot:764804-Hanusia_phi.AAC.4